MKKIDKKAPYVADDVANYFIYLSSRDFVGDNNEREGITNLKLQKILYLAQAYCLAKTSKRIFIDDIEAWNYGPVVPTIYHKYKKFKNKPIVLENDESVINSEDKELLNKIWSAFGGYSANRLVTIVHNHAPWKNAHARENKVISPAEIMEYYRPLLTNG